MRLRREAELALASYAHEQAGVVTRAQVLHCGLSDSWLRERVRSERWQRIHRGVYATFSGPVPRIGVFWAAVLCAGRSAMLSHESAAELVGLTSQPSRLVYLIVPLGHSLAPISGVVVRRLARAADRLHPSRTPPQTRIEDTVIDLTQTAATIDDAISWLARAVGGRFSTAERLLARISDRPKVRWRALLVAALADVALGCHSLLEVSYLRTVERAHGLPRSTRQVRRSDGGYDDVRYEDFATRVELDGKAAHPEHARWRDNRRDNVSVVEGYTVLRFGLGDVSTIPCQPAAQVAVILRKNGWTGTGHRCGPLCQFPT